MKREEKVGEKKALYAKKSTHIEVIHKVIDYAMSIGFEVLNLEFSPIKGPEGNIEYLVHLQKCEATDRISPEIDVEKDGRSVIYDTCERLETDVKKVLDRYK